MIDYLKETNELLDVERDCERVQLLPVACLNTGINLPDHDTTFSLLSTRIKDSQVSGVRLFQRLGSIIYRGFKSLCFL